MLFRSWSVITNTVGNNTRIVHILYCTDRTRLCCTHTDHFLPTASGRGSGVGGRYYYLINFDQSYHTVHKRLVVNNSRVIYVHYYCSIEVILRVYSERMVVWSYGRTVVVPSMTYRLYKVIGDMPMHVLYSTVVLYCRTLLSYSNTIVDSVVLLQWGAAAS